MFFIAHTVTLLFFLCHHIVSLTPHNPITHTLYPSHIHTHTQLSLLTPIPLTTSLTPIPSRPVSSPLPQFRPVLSPPPRYMDAEGRVKNLTAAMRAELMHTIDAMAKVRTVLYCTVLYCAVLCCAVLRCTLLCCAVLHCFVV